MLNAFKSITDDIYIFMITGKCDRINIFRPRKISYWGEKKSLN